MVIVLLAIIFLLILCIFCILYLFYRPFSTEEMYKEATNKYGKFTYLANEEFIGHSLSQGIPWEEKVIDFCLGFLRPEGVAIDGGGHIGCFAIPLSKKCRRVYSFEMQNEIYCLLCGNIFNNKAHNISPHNVAIGHEMGKAHVSSKVADCSSAGKPLQYGVPNPINYGGIQIGTAGQDVDMITLDSLNLEDVCFMKMDLEGFEPMAFYGARRTIKQWRPVILFESNWEGNF